MTVGSFGFRAIWLSAGFAIGLLGSVLAVQALGYPVVALLRCVPHLQFIAEKPLAERPTGGTPAPQKLLESL